jgi:hypothetical protein
VGGGKDNITVILANVPASGEVAEAPESASSPVRVSALSTSG